MNSEYQDLDLDALLELARSDAEHAGDMAEQARALREMSGDLSDKVDLMRGVMTTLFGEKGDTESGSWGGDSSRMMRTELHRLFTVAQGAPEVFQDNAKSMDEFSTKVHDTLITIDQLHVKSKGHGADTGGEQADIQQAREIMRTATGDYLRTAQAMPDPQFYNGLRESSPEASGDWTADHGATPVRAEPAAPLEPVAPAGDSGRPAAGPVLQNPAPTAPAPNPAAPPSAPVGGGGPLPVIPPAAPPSGGPPPAPRQRGGFPAPRTGPTTPAVIGPRRAPAPPAIAPRPVAPSADGTVRPVIGSRPGAAHPPAVRPEPRTDGTVRPVIGSRPGAVSAPVSRPVSMSPDGTVRPVIGARPGAGLSTGEPPAPTRAPRVNGAQELLPARYQTARPAGGVAFGNGSRPVSTTATGVPRMSPVDSESKAQPARPGQRRKPIPRQGGRAVENAITRGTNKRPPRRPGQDVFAKFDAAQRQKDADTRAVAQDDSVWGLRQVVVPAVISRRKES